MESNRPIDRNAFVLNASCNPNPKENFIQCHSRAFSRSVLEDVSTGRSIGIHSRRYDDDLTTTRRRFATHSRSRRSVSFVTS